MNSFWFRGKESQVPWQTKETTLYRYYYFFSYSELEKLARRAGFQVLKSFPESSYRLPFKGFPESSYLSPLKYFSRNICLLVRKRA